MKSIKMIDNTTAIGIDASKIGHTLLSPKALLCQPYPMAAEISFCNF